MGKTILRVLDGTVLSSELSSKLEELLPGYTVETFQKRPNYKQSIKRRIDSLHDAFLFILDAYPPDPKYTPISKETLATYAGEAMAACDLTKGDLTYLHEKLERFTGALVSLLKVNWQWDAEPVKSAIACLNEAEEYLLMSKGRPNIATLTDMDFGNGPEYIVQFDETLPPYYDQWLKELKAIKAQKFPATPRWFLKLKDGEQAYLSHLMESVTPDLLIEDLDALIDHLPKIKSIAFDWEADLVGISKQSQPLPDWFNKLSQAKKEMVTILAASSSSLERSLTKFKTYLTEKSTRSSFTTELNTVVQLPQWYLLLPKHQQAFLKQALSGVDKVEDAVSFLSSRHRTLPAPANFGAHSIIRINNQGESQILSAKRYRSSHIVSRDLIQAKIPEKVQHRHSDSNLEQVMRYATEEQQRLLQTLISPLAISDSILSSVASLVELPPDSELYKQARSTVMRSSHAAKTSQHNHPFNLAKWIYYTTAKDEDSLALIKQTEKTIDGLQQKVDELRQKITSLELESSALNLLEKPTGKRMALLQEQNINLQDQLRFNERKEKLVSLVKNYKTVIDSPVGSATFFDDKGRELFLSSLEQLIIMKQEGYSYGSCVSGKDRKAIELMHTDAMIMYETCYKKWPQFTDPDSSPERNRFVAIVADLYISGHQQELAGQNAPGSEGIKTPERYLPKDICDEINRRLGSEERLKRDDRLATDNEVKNIFTNLFKMLIDELELKAQLVSRQLGEEVCTNLYDALHALINEKHLFQVPKATEWARSLNLLLSGETSLLPAGIEAIRKLMHDEDAGNTNVQRLAKIIQIVFDRPLEGTRKPATTEVYDGIRGLCPPFSGPASLEEYTYQLIKKWKSRFEKSKAENSGLLMIDSETTNSM
jgi:hypothetical protein